MQDARGRIIQQARELFFRFNYSKVSVDEIAAGLGMSKKTIYKFFPGKEAILRQIFAIMFHQVNQEARSIVENDASDFPEKLDKLLRFMARRTQLLQMPLLAEVKLRFPDLWEQVQVFRREKVAYYLRQILRQGEAEGFFQADFDIELLIHLYSNLALAAIDPVFLQQQQRTADEVFHDIITILFAGVLTEKGRQHFDQVGLPSRSMVQAEIQRRVNGASL